MVIHMEAAKYQTPYMVENHSWNNAFIHMIAASVTVSAKTKIPT